MTRSEIQTSLQLPYRRAWWLSSLRELLPSTEVFQSPQIISLPAGQARFAAQIARIPLAEGRVAAVIEVELSGQVDLMRNRVGLRNLVARFIDQQEAHAILGLFRGQGEDYRFSFVARTSEIGADGQLSRAETAPRRYTYLLGTGQSCRTPAERLETLRQRGKAVTLDDLLKAFQVEPLFKEFFSEYGKVFSAVEALIRPTLSDREGLRLFTQRLFNRLMFIAFIERKGWLHFGPRADYLSALWDDYRTKPRKEDASTFYQERLSPLFFLSLNNPSEQNLMGINRGGFLASLVGQVPYLNGGLFDKDAADEPPGLVVPDAAIAGILDSDHGLFGRYNFTVAESTPLEIDVAVDPEMLGKVFEELVTGRHEQGSYYTPKPVVSFMCREALVEHLASRCAKESRAALEAFVHEHKPSTLRDAEAVLAALRSARVCDPACGSGAYLLGMLHELLDLRTCLFQAAPKLDAITAHERKLEIIESNLYGVDLDPFAVNVARLRLWLSLVVEFEGDQPPPLPNLDFKIEQGNALSAPAPAALAGQTSPLRDRVIAAFREKKGAYLRAHGQEKKTLRQEIDRLRTDIRIWLHSESPPDAFDWAVEFAEVFVPLPSPAALSGDLNLRDEPAARPEPEGFDIIVANPPYVRMELIKLQKPVLRKRFKEVHSERADLYVYFYARAHELLRAGGVAAFISSNKWLRAGYGESLRQHLLDTQAFRLVMDFGELPVFEAAATDAAIFLWQKKSRGESPTRWAMVKDLDRCYAEGVRSHFLRLVVNVPAARFGADQPRLATTATADLRGRMEKSGPRLGQLCKGLLGWGVKTGLNEAFIIDQLTRDELIAQSPDAAEIIKPLLAGDDVRRYELHYRGSYLIYAQHGLDIQRYPSVERHLRPFRSFKNEKGETVGLEHRATKQEWFELQQPQMAYRDFFAAPKIVYPDFGKELRFAMDYEDRFALNTAYFVAREDWYLLAVLNSAPVFQYLKGTCQLLGDGDDGGRLRFFGQYLETLPIPEAKDSDRRKLGDLAKQAQALHGRRRARAERWLRDLGLDPATSTSRNTLEQPWSLSADDFAKRAKGWPMKLYQAARDETAALTEQISKLEAEIDARVAALYGLDVEDER
jgi:methylase of polypeptide subunit release factors